MALKAYKHLTDGEVKIVESGSAEETALLADTVKDASYLQLTSAGHSQEVAAAQGSALWVDVTSDLGSGGGGSPAEVFEVTDLLIPAGTDWTGFPDLWVVDGERFFDSLAVTEGQVMLVSLHLVLAELPAETFHFGVLSANASWTQVTIAWDSPTVGVVSSDLVAVIGSGELTSSQGFLGSGIIVDPPDELITNLVGFYAAAPLTADITVVRARAAFLVI